MSEDILAKENRIRDLEAQKRLAIEQLSAARRHLQSASINKANSRGTVMVSRDGRTKNSNELRAQQFEKIFLEAREECRLREEHLKFITEALQKEINLS